MPDSNSASRTYSRIGRFATGNIGFGWIRVTDGAASLARREDYSRIDVHTCCRRRRGFNMAALPRLGGRYSTRMSSLSRQNQTCRTVRTRPRDDANRRKTLLAHPLGGDPTALGRQVHFGPFPEHAYHVEFDESVENLLDLVHVEAEEVRDVERRDAGVQRREDLFVRLAQFDGGL